MEGIISLILEGCSLARELEANLPNITNRPDMISRSCEEIINRFFAAREMLNAQSAAAAAPPPPVTLFNYPVATHGEIVFHERQLQVQQQQQQQIDVNLQEWLRSSVTRAMGIIQTQVLLGEQRNPVDEQISEREREGNTTSTAARQRSMDVSESSRGSPLSYSQPRKNRRIENARRVTVPAPQIGNTEIPPEDGHTWRKYGQKEILNSIYARSYYRCTHQKLYNCPAKKQVQRLDDDPFMFEILYRGDHTCHMSMTVPSSSVPPPPPPPPPSSSASEITPAMTSPSVTMQEPSSTSSIGHWLTIDVGASSSSGSGGAGPSSTVPGAGGPSTVPAAGDHHCFVANMADAMFNYSGSSSSNSIEFLFPSSNMEEDKNNNEP